VPSGAEKLQSGFAVLLREKKKNKQKSVSMLLGARAETNKSSHVMTHLTFLALKL